MKLFKNISFMFLTIILNIIFSMSVFADNKYSISISGASEVANGSNITFTLTALEVANITNGFDGYQGTIEYDSNMLKFISASGSINGWEFKTNTNQTNKIVFLGYDKDSPDFTDALDVNATLSEIIGGCEEALEQINQKE